MKSIDKLATATTPDGCEMQLFKHDRDFIIKVRGRDLMSSRQHESELELARLGCANLTQRQQARVLIGGLGLGYTLRQTLDMVVPNAKVVVAELLDSVIAWNRKYLGELNGHPLRDKRAKIHAGDVVELIRNSEDEYDAILLDIDNGPDALTDSGNHRLYGREGIKACKRALHAKGMLAVWSAEESRSFERLLTSCGMNVRRYEAADYKGSRQKSKVIWLASQDQYHFPEGAVLVRNIGQ